MKKLYYLAIAILCSTNLLFGQAVSTYGSLGVSGSNLVDENNNPIQLQGMSLFWSNWSEGYNFWNSGAIQTLRDDWCINVIRAAMGVEAQDGYISQPTTNLNRVKTVIDAAIALDIYVIVDFHSHNAHNYETQAKAFFSEIAQTYGSYDNIIYELYNEPLSGASWSGTIKPYCEEIIDEIRLYDADNVIICGTRQWAQRVDEVVSNPITGETNIAYSFHYYAGSHGSTQRAYAQTAIDAGYCVFVTEYGTVNADGNGSVNTSSSNEWYTWIENNNLSHCNWSVSNKNEGASILKSSVTNYNGGWSASDYSTSGTFVKDYLNAHCPNYGTSTPTITKHPDDTEVFDGYDATFTVFASGGSLSYQWYNDNGIISGATSNTYTVSSATVTDEMDYWVEVTNAMGTVTSNKAALTISATTPFYGDPIVISATTLTRINCTDFDEGNNYATTTSGASYNDDTPGNAIPAAEGNGPANYRTDTDADISTTWDDSGNRYMFGRNSAGEWWNYTVDVEAAGYYDIEIRCISGQTGEQLSLEFDGTNVTGNLTIPYDPAYYPLQGATSDNVYLEEGVQLMRLNVVSGSYLSIADIKITPSDDVDCNGDLFGTAFEDDCGACAEGNTGVPENSLCEQDCNGEWGGSAYVDNCSDCVGGSTGETACEEDCNGDWGGTAYIDGCSNCVGGNTGETECVTSVDDELNAGVSVSPNPFTNSFSIISETEVSSWIVKDGFGRVIAAGSGENVDLSGAANGIYYLNLSNGAVIKVQKQ